MGFYERQFGEQEKQRQEQKAQQPDKARGPLSGNYYRLLLDNFKFILFFVPFLIAFYIGLAAGVFPVLFLGLVLLIPTGPAVAAMYDEGFQIARGVDRHECRGFFESCRLNWKQGCATMALMVPFLAVLLLSFLVTAQRPAWVIVCLVIGCYLLCSFAIYSFSQIALVALPLRKIWKNALIVMFACGWRGVLVTVAQMAALVFLYKFIAYAFAAVLFLGPALLIAWSAIQLFPKLKAALVREDP